MAGARAVGSGLVLSRPVTFVTGNVKKLEEVRAILGQSIPFQSLKLDLPELQGEPEDISKEKARLAANEVNGSVLVEDTCLCFNALKGLPGPYVYSRMLTNMWDMRMHPEVFRLVVSIMSYQRSTRGVVCVHHCNEKDNSQTTVYKAKLIATELIREEGKKATSY